MNFTIFIHFLKFLENIKNPTTPAHCQGFIIYYLFMKILKS
jgi:hypothetical protein